MSDWKMGDNRGLPAFASAGSRGAALRLSFIADDWLWPPLPETDWPAFLKEVELQAAELPGYKRWKDIDVRLAEIRRLASAIEEKLEREREALEESRAEIMSKTGEELVDGLAALAKGSAQLKERKANLAGAAQALVDALVVARPAAQRELETIAEAAWLARPKSGGRARAEIEADLLRVARPFLDELSQHLAIAPRELTLDQATTAARQHAMTLLKDANPVAGV